MDSARAERLEPRLDWLRVGPQSKPVTLSEDELRAYEGVYGPRHEDRGNVLGRQDRRVAPQRLTV